MSKPRSAAAIGGVRKVVQTDTTTHSEPYRKGVTDALTWVLKEGSTPAFEEWESRSEARRGLMDRGKMETFLGFAISDEEWESLRDRGIASGKWSAATDL